MLKKKLVYLTIAKIFTAAGKMKFIIHCYTKNTYERLRGFPENSYEFETKEEAIKCLIDLIYNDISGIWITELIQTRFE